MSFFHSNFSIPVFSSYKKRENQVSHGLSVTLEQCPKFRQVFFKKLLSRLPDNHPLKQFSVLKLAKYARLSNQSYFGNAGFDDPDEIESNKSIPDILIQWDEKTIGNDNYCPCIVIEAKVEATWSTKQAANHYRFASKAGFDPIGVAIATDEIPYSELPEHWISISWGEIYQLAKILNFKDSFWAYQLIQLLEVTEEKLMTSTAFSGTLTEFAGIPFADPKISYHPHAARRVMRLLIKDLLQKKSDLKKIGISISEPKTISASNPDGSIWYEADPLPCYRKLVSASGKTPHLNITIGRDQFACGLTFPNASFNKIFRKGIKAMVNQGIIDLELTRLLHRLTKNGLPNLHYTPYAYLLQQHFLYQKSVPNQDAHLRVDLRTLTGYENDKKKVRIKQNTQWVEMIIELIFDKNPHCHFQAGFGVAVPYITENKSFFTSPRTITVFIIKTWQALLPFAEKIAAH